MRYQQRLQKKIQRRAGFTLVEIMLVVVIIGMLAAIALPQLTTQVDRARINTAQGQIRALGNTADLYMIDNGQYPNSLNDLVTKPGSAPNWNGPYIQKIPQADPWGNPYKYTKSGGSIDIVSDGPPGGQAISLKDL